MSPQAVTQSPCVRVARLLRRGETRKLPFFCLEELLIWVGGGRHESAQAFYGVLGQAGEDIKLLRLAYVLLDRALFVGGRLFTPAIELDSAPSLEAVQQRYRRLVIAFHPDRYPALGEWLTPRSQAINAAYSTWKENRTRLEDLESEGATEDSSWTLNPGSGKQTITNWRSKWRRNLLWLRYNLSQVKHLPHKIIAATFLLCLVPLFYLYRADELYVELTAKRTLTSAVRPSERKAEQDSNEPMELVPDMLKPLWPELASGSADRVTTFETKAIQPAPSIAATATQARAKAPVRGSAQPASTTIAPSNALSRSAQAAPRARPAHATQATAAKTKPKAGAAARARTLTQPRSESVPRQDMMSPGDSNERNIHQFNADINAITRMIESYRGSFQRGDLDAFLSHFSPNASENNHMDMGSLRPTYQKLFGETLSRSLSLDVGTISMEGQHALVRAEYRLALVYADQRRAEASGRVDYILQHADNGWKIARISYKAGGG